MKYVRNVFITLGLVVFLFGAGAVVNSLVNPVKTTGQWYLQVGGLIIGGLAASSLSYKFIPKTTGTKKEETMSTKVTETSTEGATEKKSPMLKLEEIQLADYACLNHLTKRFAEVGDADAVDNCKKLQERMFELYYGKAKEPTTT